MKKRTTAIIIIVIMIAFYLGTEIQPTQYDEEESTDPALLIQGSFNYTVYEGDCYDVRNYMQSNSYYVINGSVISVVLESCAHIDEGSLVLERLMYMNHDYTHESYVAYGEYEIVITFSTI